MTDQPDSEVDSSGVFSVDDEDQPGAEDNLDDRGLVDPLDEGYSPPEKPRGVNAFGTTFEEARRGESLEQRMAQEEPDPNAAFDDPLADEPGDRDDPDAVDDWDDGFAGDDEVGDQRAGRLVDLDEGVREDSEKDMVGWDAGIDGAGASAEEAAVHIVDEP
ncbi:DUF5709 domain-containing protein [Angustibacter sp. McL0619]|uniref:DUF5709 domain-containing protein n=1 Tax=Angustibacter sp. McL0619 TaxID=3415676 RepID=UPI003CEE5EA5